jgi:putative ABC transport system ATP-binding protein
MRTDAPIISCYHTKAQVNSHVVLDDVNLSIDRGTWCELVGEPGSGKSTLFDLFSLRRPSRAGKLLVCGRNLARLGGGGLAKLRRRIGSVAQHPLLLNDYTVRQNIWMPYVASGKETAKGWERLEEVLQELQLVELCDVPVGALSLEERVLVAIGRALVTNPELVVIDAALEQLGAPAQRRVMSQLQQAHLAGGTIVLFGREESGNARRGLVYRIADGEVTPADESAGEAPRFTGAVA